MNFVIINTYFIMEVWVTCCLWGCNLTVPRTRSNQVYIQMMCVGEDRKNAFFFSQHVRIFSQLLSNCIANPIKYLFWVRYIPKIGNLELQTYESVCGMIFMFQWTNISVSKQKNKILQYTKDKITGLKSSLRVTGKCAYCLDFSILPQDVAFRS